MGSQQVGGLYKMVRPLHVAEEIFAPVSRILVVKPYRYARFKNIDFPCIFIEEIKGPHP